MTQEQPDEALTARADAYASATAVPERRGSVAWALGFLAYIPIPVLGSVVTGIVMALVGNAQRDKGEVARLNGRNAANWGLSYLLATVALIGGAVLLLAIASGGGGRVPEWATVLALTAVFLWAFPLQILHLVITIIGTVKSSKGEVFDNRAALPLLR